MFVRWAEESTASPPEEKERGRGRKCREIQKNRKQKRESEEMFNSSPKM